MNGVLPLDKPPGPTSHDAVDAVRRTLGERRVGHFGTLDPFATGLLVVGIGKATRLAPFCTGHAKTYRAVVRLGARSDTDDPEGEITPVPVAAPPAKGEIEEACARRVGEVEQVPPAYSAKKIGGDRAYRLARAGEAVSLPPVRVRIDSITLLAYDFPDVTIEVACGPGTYIRSLARDVGEDLGTGAYCAELRRTRSGPFRVEEALAWEGLADPEAARSALVPAGVAVADLPALDLDDEAAVDVSHGRPVPAPEGIAPEGAWVVLRAARGFIGLAERRGERLLPRRVLFPEGEEA